MTGTVLVLGASGGIGQGVVEALLEADYEVIAVARDAQHLASLAEGRGERLRTIAASLATDDSAAALVDRLRSMRVRPLAVVAAMAGHGGSSRLVDQPADHLRRALDADVVSHFVAVRHLAPLLAEANRESTYLIVSGPAAECPWAGYGHRSVAAAALRMLTLVLREELKTLPVRLRQLQIGSPVRTHRNDDCGCPDWLSAADVGRRIVALIADRVGNDPVVRIGGYWDLPKRAPQRARTTETNVEERS